MSKRGNTGKKKNSGCGCLLLLIIVFAVYAAGQSDKKMASALPTVARIDTAMPRPTRTMRPPTIVPTVTTAAEVVSVAQVEPVVPVRDQITQLATAYPEEALKAVLGAANGVNEVTTAMVTLGPSVYAEVQVQAGQADERMANRLRLALVIEEEIAEYVFILDDGRQVVDYTYRDGEWRQTQISIFTPIGIEAISTTPPLLLTPTRIATRRPTTAPAGNAEVLTVPDRDYWAANGINVRSCASTTCDAIGRVNQGTKLTANGQTEGEAVNSGNKLWYRVQYGGGYGFVYSGVVTDRAPVVAPTAAPQVQSQPPAQPPVNTNRVPRNCTEAVEMGLSPEQAAQYSHLDRDNDGVACYGD